MRLSVCRCCDERCEETRVELWSRARNSNVLVDITFAEVIRHRLSVRETVDTRIERLQEP